MKTIWIIGDQLSPTNAALAQADPAQDVVLLQQMADLLLKPAKYP